GIDLITGGHHHEEDEHEDDDHEHEHDHEHDEFDPHVWHDPANVKIMTDNIVAAISAEDSSLSDSVSANGEAYKDVLDETDRKILDLIDAIPEERRVLVTTHDAFEYFIHAYVMLFIGAVIPLTATDSEHSSKDVAAIS